MYPPAIQPTVRIAELIPLHRRTTLPANDTGASASVAGDMAARPHLLPVSVPNSGHHFGGDPTRSPRFLRRLMKESRPLSCEQP